jgi:aspartate racemase
MKTLGMIGGISWASTIEYYEGINKAVNQRVGGAEYPRLVLYSLNFGEVQAMAARNDWDAFFEMTAGIAPHLRSAGAEGLLLCANTAHIVADRLQERVGLPIINIMDATARAVTAAGIKTVALLGTQYTMEMDFFRDRLTTHGITTIIPAADDRAFIHASIFEELARGIVRDDTRGRYVRIISSLGDAGAEGAILGCTEIPLLIKAKDTHLPTFDTTAIHVAAATEFILS